MRLVQSVTTSQTRSPRRSAERLAVRRIAAAVGTRTRLNQRLGRLVIRLRSIDIELVADAQHLFKPGWLARGAEIEALDFIAAQCVKQFELCSRLNAFRG